MTKVAPYTTHSFKATDAVESNSKTEDKMDYSSLSKAWNAEIPSDMSIPTAALTSLAATTMAILPISAPLITVLVFPEECGAGLSASWKWFPVATVIGSVSYLYPAIKRSMYCKELGREFCMDVRELTYRTVRVLDTGVRKSFNYLTS